MFNRNTNRRRVPLKVRAKQAAQWVKSAARRVVPVLILAAIAVGVPIAVFQGYLHVVSTPYFAVENLQIKGLNNLGREDVLKQAGIVPGVNAFDLDPDAIRQRLESQPWIRRVRVERRLPDTLEINVEERVATAVLVDGASYVLLDSSGEPFKTLEPGDPVDRLLKLPLVTGLSRAETESESGQQFVIDALEVVRLANSLGLPELSEVHVDRVLGLSVVPADSGIEIRLGRGRYDERLKRLRAVLATVEREGRSVDYILLDQEEKLNRVTVGSRAAGMANDDDETRNQ